MRTNIQIRHRLSLFVTSAILLMALPVGTGSANASSMTLDPSFGNGGYSEVSVDPGESGTYVMDMAIDSQDRTTSLLFVDGGSDSSLTMLVRTLPSGILDTTFSGDGKSDVIKTINAQTLELQHDGKILVGGSNDTQNGVQAIRFTESGELDTEFGTNGVAASPTFGSRMIEGAIKMVARQSGFVMATSFDSSVYSNAEVVVIAFNEDGSMRGEFGTAGIATVAPVRTGASRFTSLMDVTVLSNDQIVAVITGMGVSGGGVTWLARFTTQGILDPTFDGVSNGNGLVQFRDSATTDFYMTSVVLNSDDSMTLTGLNGTYYYGPHYVATMKVTANGILDASYGSSGISTTSIGGQYPSVGSISKSNANKYFVTVTTNLGIDRNNPQQSNVLSFTSSGVLDTSFDGDGVKNIPDDGSRIVRATAVAPNSTGTIIVSLGYWGTTEPYELIRLTSTGANDSTYGILGRSTSRVFGFAHDLSNQHVLEQIDGKLLISSEVLLEVNPMSSTPEIFGVEVVRLNADGTIDNTYGNRGRVRLKVPSYSTEISDNSLQPDGKLLISVFVQTGLRESDAGIFRLNEDGTLDTTFDTDGFKSLSSGASNWITSTESLSNGAVVASGWSNDGQGNTNFWIAKMHSDGSLDASFDGDSGASDGVVPLTNFCPEDFKVVEDGFVLVGEDLAGVGSIMKVDSAGRVVTSFATNGQGVFPVSDGNGGSLYSWFGYLIKRANGGFVAIGGVSNSGLGVTQLLAFNPDGSLDVSFDGPTGSGNGLVTYTQPVTGTVFIAETIAVDGDGFVLTGNTKFTDGGEPRNIKPVIRHITSTGAYDSNYGINGETKVIIAASNTEANSGFVSRNGGVIVVGSHQTNTAAGIASFVAKLRDPSTTTTTTSTTSTTSTTITPTTTIPTPVTTLPVASPVTGSIAKSLTIGVGKSITRTSLLKQLALTIPKGGKATLAVSSPKTCKVVGTSVRGVAKGSCSIRITITPSKGAAKRYSKTLKIT